MPNVSSGRGLRSRLPMVATALTLVTTLSSCGLLGGSDDEESKPSGDGKLETTEIQVSIMKTTDLVPFHLAMENGYFEDEGLTVKTVDAESGGASVNKLIGGEVDIAYSSYTPFFSAESKGAAKAKGGIKLVAEASSAGKGATVVVATQSSGVKSVKDMANKKVAVTAPGTISDLLTMSTLKTNGVDWKTVQWVPTPFPQTAQRLAAGDVDAAFATDPWIVAAQKEANAVPIFDTAEGPTENFPTAGWGSTGEFVDKNPKTIAAFQRVMQKATEEALNDRSKVEPLLEKYSKVDADTAAMATFLTFQSKIDAKRVQRVPDLMLEFEVIPEALDASKMVVESAPTS